MKKDTRPQLICDMKLDQHTLIDYKKFNVIHDKDNIDPNKVTISIGMLSHRDCDIKLGTIRKGKYGEMKELEDFGINVPEYHYHKDLSMLYTVTTKKKEWILKNIFGAKSRGQIPVDREIFFKFLYNINSLTDAEMCYNYFDNDSDRKEHKRLINDMKSMTGLLVKKIKFKAEYRILLFNSKRDIKDIIIEKRTGYKIWENKNRVHEVIKYKDCKDITKSMIDKLYAFMKDKDAPAMSFDVYVQKNGEWGCFEYSTQFGILYDADVLDQIVTDYTNALRNCLKTKLSEDSKAERKPRITLDN